jgi:hypothetical protein
VIEQEGKAREVLMKDPVIRSNERKIAEILQLFENIARNLLLEFAEKQANFCSPAARSLFLNALKTRTEKPLREIVYEVEKERR